MDGAGQPMPLVIHDPSASCRPLARTMDLLPILRLAKFTNAVDFAKLSSPILGYRRVRPPLNPPGLPVAAPLALFSQMH